MSSSTHSEPRATRGEPFVAFDRIEKSFFGVKVLKGVSFNVGLGRILGLVGENGAGKSTLMNLLGGNLQAEAGALRVNGRPYAPNNPKDARLAGIAKCRRHRTRRAIAVGMSGRFRSMISSGRMSGCSFRIWSSRSVNRFSTES